MVHQTGLLAELTRSEYCYTSPEVSLVVFPSCSCGLHHRDHITASETTAAYYVLGVVNEYDFQAFLRHLSFVGQTFPLFNHWQLMIFQLSDSIPFFSGLMFVSSSLVCRCLCSLCQKL